MGLSTPTDESSVILKSDIVRARINTFWGYGSLNASTWFVGMEEGLSAGVTALELHARFNAAHGKQTIDMRRDMQNVSDHMRWFKKGAPIQATWKFPIALFLYLKHGRQPNTDEIREYQIMRLGDSELQETACIELMPLPSNKAHERTWLYADSGVEGCATRAEYLKMNKSTRVAQLSRLIRAHRPKLVIFYSLTYLNDWKLVIGADPHKLTEGMHATEVDGTLFCVIPQSASFGMSYARLYEYADHLKERFSISLG